MATLPEGAGVQSGIQRKDMPTNTFLIDWTSNQIAGMDDGISAMRQAVEIALQNERFRWQIYNSNFGSEWKELIGDDFDYIKSELPRRIEDALSIDKRILSVENYVFQAKGNSMTVSFGIIAWEVSV